ncbi:MAG: clostripain-related cysteine peptidase [Candidatus Cloacimonadota bacterium]|nr:clostripain-related cysteine peptidase [Candidatus Cloacimonadota bacterium]
MMKKIILLSFVIFTLLSCSKIEESDWTILIYMAADNSLEYEALDEIADMMQAEFSDNINVIVQIDYSESNSPPAAYRYHIYPGSKEQISYLGEIDSGDENELTAFANWGFRKYPSEKQALVIWSHGNGWYPYFCPDIEAGNDIGIANGELRTGIKNINEHLEILIFDACNMQTVEVAAEVADYTDYIIGSEGGVNSAGFPYAEIFSVWEEQTSVESICLEIGFQYHLYYDMIGINPFSCSVLKTSEFPQLLNKLEEFTVEWSADAAAEIFMQSRQDCLEFNPSGFTNPALDVDIKEFFTNVYNNTENDSLSTISSEILTAIETCYIFQKTDEFPTGYPSFDVGSAIIWFPDAETQGFFDIRQEEYRDLQFSQTNWLDFLEHSFTN